MFEVGKKYVFSRRKFIKACGKLDSKENWVRRLIGVVFVADSYSSYGHVMPYGWVSDNYGLEVCRSWCTEIK